MATELNKENFREKTVENSIPSVVDFWAEWCGPCQMMGPVFEELSEEFDGKILFGKVDVDSQREIASEFGIRGIPTIIVFKGGSEAGRFSGFMPKEDLRKKILEIVG
jgi:thioredoxin 1